MSVPGDGETRPTRNVPRLLLVMPNAQLQAALGVAVQAFARVDLVASAEEALETAAMHPPDVTVLDADVPDMLCIDLARALLRRRHRCALVIVASTSDTPRLRGMSRLPLAGFFLTRDSLHTLVQRLFVLLGRRRLVSVPVASVIAQLAHHTGSPRTVAELAAAAHVSPSLLLRRFREEIGLTVKNYAVRVQTTLAQRMLRETEEKLDQIAQVTGFADASHLSRVFMQHVGVRPGAYRRRYRLRVAL